MENRQQKPVKLISKNVSSGLKSFTMEFLKGVWWGMGPDPRKKSQKPRRDIGRYG